MSVNWLSRACLSGLAVVAAGCAGQFDPAHFQGSREPQRAEPEALRDVAVLTNELQLLGTVRVGCRLQPGFRRLHDELLSDVDCSRERLLFALRESAASAGGELLVAAQCNSRRAATDSPQAQQLECAAGVARYLSGPLANPDARPLSVPRSSPPGRPAPSARDVKRIDEPNASLAFRISLSFEPRVASYERPARPGDQVRELPELPLSHRSLGDLVASCAAGCDERALRYGVLLAAGRLGAPDVVSVRCYSAGSGNACVGTLAAPEIRE